MRRPRFRNRSHDKPQIRIGEIRLTTEEILGDLLYPAVPAKPAPSRPKARH